MTVVVVLAHHQLPHIARRHLGAHPAPAEHIPHPAGHCQQPIGQLHHPLTVAHHPRLPLIQLLDSMTLATVHRDISLSIHPLRQGRRHGGRHVAHIHKRLAAPRGEHQRSAVGRQQQPTRRGLNIHRTNHIARVHHHHVPLGVPPRPFQQQPLAITLAFSVVAPRKGRPHRLLLVGGVVGRAVADGVHRRSMHQRPDSKTFHHLQQRGAERRVHRPVVLAAQQAHVGHAGAVDDGVAIRRHTEQRGEVGQRPRHRLPAAATQPHRVGPPHQHAHRVPLVQQTTQHIVAQQAGRSEQQHSHGI